MIRNGGLTYGRRTWNASRSLLPHRLFVVRTLSAASGLRTNKKVGASSSSSPSWVPPAYRGLGEEVKRNSRRDRRTGRSSDKDNRPGRSDDDFRSSRRGRPEVLTFQDTEKAMIAMREQEESISILLEDLMRLAPQYRNHFQKDVAAPSDDDARVLPPSNFLQKRILTALKGIHQSNLPLEQKQVQDTEEDFRSLFRTLQYMCSISCSLTNMCKSNDKKASKYVDLAEFLVLQLVQLCQDRSIMIDSVKQFNTPKVSAEIGAAPGELESPRTVTGWFTRLVEGFVPSLAIAEKEVAPVESGMFLTEEAPASHVTTSLDDPSLQAMKRLLRIVTRSIASTVQKPGTGTEEQQNTRVEYGAGDVVTVKSTAEDRTAYEVAARRMLDLLDRMPSSWPPDTEVLRYPMEVLGRAGTLQSARLCNTVFQRHKSDQCRLQFTLVLDAYLEAVMRETDKYKLLDLVEEVVNVLSQHWNASLPTHRVERIVQCSIVLNCMTAANMGDVPGICDRGDMMAKRALGGQIYAQLRQEVHSGNPKVDPQTLPVANYLAQLYASSGDEGRVGLAKKMLNYMIQHDRDGGNRFMAFPHVDTCNAVLLALLQRYEGKSSSDEEAEAAQMDFYFAQEVMDYMYGRSETVCWPNADTRSLMFRFLDTANPADIGKIAEDLLSTIEARQILSRSSTDKITLSTYHRVMRYWLQVAKTPLPLKAESHAVACERAFHLLKKLEMQSMPMVLSDNTLSATTLNNLYDISLRPVRETYEVVLHICAETSEPEYYEKAAAIAFAVYRQMIKRGIAVSDDAESLLISCSSRLAPESNNRIVVETFLSSEVSEESLCDDHHGAFRSAPNHETAS